MTSEATQFARLFGREIINPFKINVAPLIKKNGKKRKTIFLGTEFFKFCNRSKLS